MLKSIDFINRLEMDLESEINSISVLNFFIELRINHYVDVYIVSDSLSCPRGFVKKEVEDEELSNKKVRFTLLRKNEAESEEYSYLFSDKKVSLGLRRSLSSLLTDSPCGAREKSKLITFYSYKGGVGRTTSLALTATFLSRQGKNVFVIDCDFEAPGILNFFNSSQSDKCKSGLVEYLNDKEFIESVDIVDYIYNIDKVYSGRGVINLLPAGNVLSSHSDTLSYLEGLAKIDLQGDMFFNLLNGLISDITSKYNPDVILVDSRTGFNSVFGALSKVSKHVVFLAGDDIQNQPGIEYVTKSLNEQDVSSSFVLSILSSNFSRRYDNYSKQIQGLSKYDSDIFYFDRQNTLEFIGTSLEDSSDVNDFIDGENGSVQYKRFFKHIIDIVNSFSDGVEEDLFAQELHTVDEQDELEGNDLFFNREVQDANDDERSIEDIVLCNIRTRLPDLYAENIDYSSDYVEKYFYYRPCMESLFIPEKAILLGDKGTGKTAFYKALQNNDFFDRLVVKSQKKNMNYKVVNVTDFEKDNFEFLGFDSHVKNELFIKKFWLFFIWNSLFSKGGYETSRRELLIDLSLNPQDKIIEFINDPDKYSVVESELDNINNELRGSDNRLIITFDQLDNIVKPFLWNDVVSPLVKIAMRFPYTNIHPKLFLRRDLYDRLGNLTNKNSFSSRIIDLEWSQDEIFSYFLKIIFSYSESSFFDFLEARKLKTELIVAVRRKLKTKGFVHNQLPLDKYVIAPIINVFFGSPKPKRNGKTSTAYDDLYRNIQSADKTVNLRPFIDLLTNAISEQDEQDKEKEFRQGAVIGLAYCTSKSVRKNAVVKYLEDLWNEQGNEFVKCFCLDFSKNKISPEYKKSIFSEHMFEKLLIEIKNNNREDGCIRNGTLEEFKQVLMATKIITPYMVGNKTRYGIAYLYTNYLGV